MYMYIHIYKSSLEVALKICTILSLPMVSCENNHQMIKPNMI